MIYDVGDQRFTYWCPVSARWCSGRRRTRSLAEMIDEDRVTALWAGFADGRALDTVLTARPDLDAAA